MDILGYKEQIKKSSKNVDTYLKTIKNAVNDVKVSTIGEPLFNMPSPKVRIFSDNILIYVPVPHGMKYGTLVQIDRIITIAGIIKMTFMISHNLLVRGSLVMDKFYADDDLIFGPAIVKAYDLEQEAKYPRIVVSNEIFEIVQQIIAKNEHCHDYGYAIAEDFDGKRYCVNILKQLVDRGAIEQHIPKNRYMLWIKEEKRAIEKIVSEYYNQKDKAYFDGGIFEKYLWILKDHNLISSDEPENKINYAIKHNENLCLIIEIIR